MRAYESMHVGTRYCSCDCRTLLARQLQQWFLVLKVGCVVVILKACELSSYLHSFLDSLGNPIDGYMVVDAMPVRPCHTGQLMKPALTISYLQCFEGIAWNPLVGIWWLMRCLLGLTISLNQ